MDATQRDVIHAAETRATMAPDMARAVTKSTVDTLAHAGDGAKREVRG